MTSLLNSMSDRVQAVGRIFFDGDDRKKRYPGKISVVPMTLPEENKRVCFMIDGGRRADFSDSRLRTLTADFVRHALKLGFSHLALELERPGASRKRAFSPSASEAAAEGAFTGAYSFTKYLSGQDGQPRLESFTLTGGSEEGLARGRISGDSIIFARSLANEPPDVLTPEAFVDVGRRLAGLEGLLCEFFDDREIEGFGMNALLAVGKGSVNPPRLLHLTYRPGGFPRRRIVIAGKGITFDSGGLSLKTHEGMKNMKYDKSGACVVLGAMKAAAELKLPVEVHGIAGLAENMPDGGACRPGDIITAMNGKTIEIENTDAEGRLVLADVLTFASRLEPDAIIDVATLTGAAKTALGRYTAAMLCDDDRLSAALEAASQKAGERFHRFKMDDELLREGLRGMHADLRQSSPQNGGGTIAGGMFLREFVASGIPWAHLDIAATGWYDREFGVYSKGASAYSLATIIEYLRAVSGA